MLNCPGLKNTYIQISLIRRKSKGRKYDVIRMEYLSLGDKKPHSFDATPHEALKIATGLTWAVQQFLGDFKPYYSWEDSLDKK